MLAPEDWERSLLEPLFEGQSRAQREDTSRLIDEEMSLFFAAQGALG